MADLAPIQFKRSSTLGLEPNPNDIAVGELAINFPSSKIFSKDSDGNIVTLGLSTEIIDSDVSYRVDSEGVLLSTSRREANITIISEGSGTSWQNAAPLADIKVGTKVQVLRTNGSGTFFEFDRTANTHDGWDGILSSDNIAELNYAGTASYVVASHVFNSDFNPSISYEAGGDHATFSTFDNVWFWQVFETPVNIGDGTKLGTILNGRPAYPSTEFFKQFRVTFYDKDYNILADQSFTPTEQLTLSLDTAANITGCKSIMIRAHDGNNPGSLHPGINEINFYVNGSTAYPTATEANSKWGAAHSNVNLGVSLGDSDEALCLVRFDTGGAILVAGAHQVFGTGDWCSNGTTHPNDQVYNFWFNKEWTMAPGTFGNYRSAYTNQFWQNVDFDYYDTDGNSIATVPLENLTSSASQPLPAGSGVSKIVMATTNMAAIHASITRWYPNLGRLKGTPIGSIAVTSPEIWIKASSAPYDLFVNGGTTTVPPWVQLLADNT